jgi:hypothetical protein
MDPVPSSKCWPGLGINGLDQDLPDTQISPAGNFKVSNNLLELDRFLPGTQRNSTSSQIASHDIAAQLHQLDEGLPDTQRSVLDHQDTPVTSAVETDSQLPDTQRIILPTIQRSMTLPSSLDQFLPESQTQVIDHENALGAATQSAKSQTTYNENIVGNRADQDLPDTQPNTLHWASPLLSLAILPLSSQDLLLPNTQGNYDCLEARLSNAEASIRLPQSVQDFTDTQVSSAGNPELPNLADIPFLKSGIALKPSQLHNQKEPFNKITCRERKRIVVSPNRPPALTKAMCQWVDSTNHLLDPFLDEEECWFHPSPPPAHLSMNGILRPCGKLQKRFNWKDRNGKHSLVLNFGIALKLANYKMTKQQKDGFINKQWHLSHLCGNWTCLNPAHTTVEPGNVNISRNNCFSHRSGCLHNPPCMKDKKVLLGADGKLVDHTASTSSNVAPLGVDDWDDWSVQAFDNGDSMLMDDNKDSEAPAYQNGVGSFIIIDDNEDEDEL